MSLQPFAAVRSKDMEAGSGQFFSFHTAAELLPRLRRATSYGGAAAVLLFDSDRLCASLCCVAQVVRWHFLCQRVMWQEMRSQDGALTERDHLT